MSTFVPIKPRTRLGLCPVISIVIGVGAHTSRVRTPAQTTCRIHRYILEASDYDTCAIRNNMWYFRILKHLKGHEVPMQAAVSSQHNKLEAWINN